MLRVQAGSVQLSARAQRLPLGWPLCAVQAAILAASDADLAEEDVGEDKDDLSSHLKKKCEGVVPCPGARGACGHPRSRRPHAVLC